MKKEYFINNNSNGTTTKLFLQDCIEGLKDNAKNKTVSVVVTSPPYNIGINYSKYNDNLSPEEYEKLIKTLGKQINRVLEDDGSFFLNIGSSHRNPYLPFSIVGYLRDEGFCLQNVIHWVKSIAITKQDVLKNPNITADTTIGHYKPINSNRFLNDCHEYIFHFTKECKTPLDRLAVGVPYQDKSNIKRWKVGHNDKKCRGNTWFIPYQTIQSRDAQRPHPASFPVALPEMCIKLHGIKNTHLVLDPFIGIGSTALACQKLGVNCMGFDIDKTYLDIASNAIISSQEEIK